MSAFRVVPPRLVRVSRPRFRPLALLLAAFACGGDGGTTEPTGNPSAEVVLAATAGGTAQAAAIGSLVPVAPGLRVTDGSGAPRAGVTVRFAVTAGGGTVAPSSVVTGADGVATVERWTMGTAAGPQTLTAEVEVAGRRTYLAFSATAHTEGPGWLVTNTSDRQTAAPGRVVTTAPGVRLTDGYLNPIVGAVVTFVVVEGGGSVRHATATTDAAGLASAGEWRLGTGGAQYLEARVDGAEPVHFLGEIVPFGYSTAVFAGQHRTCTLSVDGIAFCWGIARRGPIGDGTTADAPRPSGVDGPQRFTQLALAPALTCGLDADGVAHCWGQGGSTGDGTRTLRLVPTPVATAARFTSLVSKGADICGVATSGQILCWGEVRGSASATVGDTPQPLPGARPFATFGAGMLHTCGIEANGRAYCWGANDAGQLGDGSTTDRTTPTAVFGPLDFTAIGGGERHTCALARDGSAHCWGRNTVGQLGDGSETGRAVPTAVATAQRFASLAVGANHACGSTSAGEAYCWGLNGSGQLGSSEAGMVSLRPVRVETAARFASLAAGEYHTCGRTDEGQVYCWGDSRSSTPALVTP